MAVMYSWRRVSLARSTRSLSFSLTWHNFCDTFSSGISCASPPIVRSQQQFHSNPFGVTDLDQRSPLTFPDSTACALFGAKGTG